MKSRLLFNILLIIFVLCTLYALRGQIIALYDKLTDKDKEVQTVDDSPDGLNNSAAGTTTVNDSNHPNCRLVDQNLKQRIGDLQSSIQVMGIEIDEMKKAIDKANAEGGADQPDIEAYNAKVKQYNELVAQEKSLVAEYNAQVKAYNNCVE